MDIARTVETATPIDRVFPYLADFTTAAQWDPNTSKVERTSGDGGVGTVYATTSSFAGRELILNLEVVAYEPNHRIQFLSADRNVQVRDTVTCEATPTGGTRITYSSHVTYSGVAKLFGPFLRRSFERLFDSGATGLKQAVDALGGNAA